MKARLGIFFIIVLGLGRAVGADTRPPNIVFILADDLGFGDLGCYGQTKFKTPNIDRLATEGLRLGVHYSGSSVCAPSRCALMTGHHPGHGAIRENRQFIPKEEGQWPVPEGSLSLPLRLQKLGYTNGIFGKWGLGAPGTTGEPLRQGFSRFYGYNCQGVAHNYYPTFLWSDAKRVPLRNPDFASHQKLAPGTEPRAEMYIGADYAPDLISQQAREFMRANQNRPFFLYYASTVPHLALQIPADSLAEFSGRFPEEPYDGSRGYLPHPTPRAAYAAMITRLDLEVGRLLDLLKELKLENETIVVFTSDNGPLYDRLGGTDCDFFQSAGAFRGRKGSLYEGGVRVPCLVRWPGHIAAAQTSMRVTGFEDWLPTLLELAAPKDSTVANIDGISFAPTLLGKEQAPRPFLYRETPGYGGQQSVRTGDWKAVRQQLNPGPKNKLAPGGLELYDLGKDPNETTDVAGQHPEISVAMSKLLTEQHSRSDAFPIRALDLETQGGSAPVAPEAQRSSK